MHNISIRMKLFSVPAILLAVFLALFFIYHTQNNVAQRMIGNAFSTSETMVDYLETRISVYQFLRNPNSDTATKVVENLEKNKQAVMKLKSAMKREEQQKRCTEAISLISNYIDIFKTVSPKIINNSVSKEEQDKDIKHLADIGSDVQKYLTALQTTAKEGGEGIIKSVEKILMISFIVSFIISLGINLFVTKDLLKSIRTLTEGITSFVQTKDLRLRISYTNKDEIKEMVDELNILLAELERTIKDAKHTSGENASVSHELSSTSIQIGKNAEDSSRIVENAIKDIHAIKSFISDSAKLSESTKDEISLADQKLNSAKDEITKLKQEVDAASEAENTLADKLDQMSSEAEQVKQILLVIGDIADQTNLLALNAAIEAARAGDHGRGFAVVADEVRKLAERTQKSLVEINSTISTIVQSIVDAAEQMSHNAKNIQKLVSVSSNVENTIVETTTMMRNSTRSVVASTENSMKVASDSEKIVYLVGQINDLTSQNARSVEEIAATAEHLFKLTENLNEKLNQFKS